MKLMDPIELSEHELDLIAAGWSDCGGSNSNVNQNNGLIGFNANNGGQAGLVNVGGDVTVAPTVTVTAA